MKIHLTLQKDRTCLGLIETSNIARGILTADRMLKEASIEILLSTPTSPGYYLNLIAGEVEEVRSALEAGESASGSYLRDRLFLPNIHPQVLSALYHIRPLREAEALGILESTTQASLLVSADRAVKRAEITLIHIHLGIGIGGKAFFVMAGPYDEVEEARESASAYLAKKNCLLDEVVIGNVDPQLLPILLQQKLPQRSLGDE